MSRARMGLAARIESGQRMNIIDSALVPPPTPCSEQLVVLHAQPGVLERLGPKRLKLLQGRVQP